MFKLYVLRRHDHNDRNSHGLRCGFYTNHRCFGCDRKHRQRYDIYSLVFWCVYNWHSDLFKHVYAVRFRHFDDRLRGCICHDIHILRCFDSDD